MRQLLKLLKVPSFNSKGFTLIELLVVIGILGILASALVATIDPFEQLKKGTDAKRQNITVEFFNANLRYYTTHSALPWDVLVADGGCGPLNPVDPTALALGSVAMDDCLDVLIDEGELKAGFKTVTADLDAIYLNEEDNDMKVCFSPESKSQRAATNTKYLNTGEDADPADCPDGNADAGECYWCTQ